MVRGETLLGGPQPLLLRRPRRPNAAGDLPAFWAARISLSRRPLATTRKPKPFRQQGCAFAEPGVVIDEGWIGEPVSGEGELLAQRWQQVVAHIRWRRSRDRSLVHSRRLSRAGCCAPAEAAMASAEARRRADANFTTRIGYLDADGASIEFSELIKVATLCYLACHTIQSGELAMSETGELLEVDPRYPVGRFKRPEKITPQKRLAAIATLAELPEKLSEAWKKPGSRSARHAVPRGWMDRSPVGAPHCRQPHEFIPTNAPGAHPGLANHCRL